MDAHVLYKDAQRDIRNGVVLLQNNKNVDVLIIGAGPAGLCAAYVLTKRKQSVLVVEKGKWYDNRNPLIETDVPSGVGGCGLFSDGKVSYHPAASNLWHLDNAQFIESAYEEVCKLMDQINIQIRPWNSEWVSKENQYPEGNRRKLYDSEYINKVQRANFIKHVCSLIGDNRIIIEQRATLIRKIQDRYEVHMENGQKIIATTIIYSAGKLGALYLKKLLPDTKYTFRKFEVGVRVELPSVDFPFYYDDQVDYKFIKKINNDIELRTFCCVRDGTVIRSRDDSLISFNGSCTDHQTNKSSIGLNLRLYSQYSDPDLFNEMERIIQGKCNPFDIQLANFLSSNNVSLGPKIDCLLKEFIIEVLGTNYNENDAIVYGPTIECTGDYPIVETFDLKLGNDAIWLSGDCCGVFRGLLAALVSGAYVALQIDSYLREAEMEIRKQLQIKESPTEEMALVFTAQSKAYFYCRDVICQYVFGENLLPINPFRVFDYFLGDRVDRNIIRRGNNQLISKCDELWVFGPISDGVLFEIAFTKTLGRPIRYFSIGTKIEDIKPITIDEVVFEPEVHARQVKKEDLIRFLKENTGVLPDKQPEIQQLVLDLGEY